MVVTLSDLIIIQFHNACPEEPKVSLGSAWGQPEVSLGSVVQQNCLDKIMNKDTQ